RKIRNPLKALKDILSLLNTQADLSDVLVPTCTHVYLALVDSNDRTNEFCTYLFGSNTMKWIIGGVFKQVTNSRFIVIRNLSLLIFLLLRLRSQVKGEKRGSFF